MPSRSAKICPQCRMIVCVCSKKPPTKNSLYGYAWNKARAAFLAKPENLFCRECRKRGRYTEAIVVDHIIPHRNDLVLFWDQSNYQALCVRCHNTKSSGER